MSKRTSRECTYLFCKYVIELYRDIYLQHPTKSDVEQLYAVHQAKHGFLGMLEEEGRAICSYTKNDILNPPTVIQVVSPIYFSRVLEIQNRETHHNLRHDLTKQLWERQIQWGNDDEDESDDEGVDVDTDDEASEDADDNE
uniref:Uncharacterized protein n=1 Tax=Lactuca sativa TaxID=4236 RepID=A0A9R1V2M8_LACSA|nr:hypothetical protein LSAT_V11C700384360 [Lactuca sativa]